MPCTCTSSAFAKAMGLPRALGSLVHGIPRMVVQLPDMVVMNRA
jgi:hypothetical protein